MSAIPNLKLSWFQDVASVIEENDGRSFEIGTVILETLANTVVGCTYYHHILLAYENSGGQASIGAYGKRIKAYQHKFKEAMDRIKKLRKSHPEIPEDCVDLDDPDEPEFFDLSIPIPFPVPYRSPATQRSYEAIILQQITNYVKILGTLHELEILRIEKR